MSKPKIELNYAGVGAILKSTEMQQLLVETARKIAGDGDTETYVAGTRAVANAYSTKQDNEMLRRM